MVDAKERHKAVMEALWPPQQTASFRGLMMKAYGFDEPAIGDLTRTARQEKEFAEKCLRGEGPTQQELTITGDLRAVLLKEIGLVPEPDHVDESTGERIPIAATPWLMGDWVRMAGLIIHYAGLDREHDHSSHEPTDMVRLYPIDFNEGLQGWSKEKIQLAQERTDRVECFIKTYDRKMNPQSLCIRLQAEGSKHKSYRWLILPEGASQIKSSSRDEGLARNLWSGLPYPPGTPQEDEFVR